MSNLNVNDVISAFSAAGVEVVVQKKFLKFPQDKKAVYVAISKSGRVSRVDISGFSVESEAVAPPKKKNGKVTGQVNMQHDEAVEAIDKAITGLTNGKLGSKWFDLQYVSEDNKKEAVAMAASEYIGR